MARNITYEDVLLLMMPFGDELIEWCDKNEEFKKLLRLFTLKDFCT